MYNYVQNVGGEEQWQPIPNSRLAEYIQQHSPMFTTVLAVSALVEEGMSREDIDKLTYQGPMYFDWDDGEDVSNTIPQVIKFLKKLEELGVNPHSLHLFATGGKGFHCEIPQPVWLDKMPKGGMANLPIIFKEIALDLAVDTLDLRVYSAKKGRMWRRPNVQRPNGKYKVPISYTELLEMDRAKYDVLVSAPREDVKRAAPDYALNLAMLFDKMKQKVSGMIAKRRKAKVVTSTFKADMPSLQALCEGRGIKDGVGFNQIAMQLAIVAHQLGWSEEQLADRCSGLVSSHQSDGARYNSEAKRRNDLIRMHRYMADNPCYDATVGGLKSLLKHAAPDLDGIPVSKEDVEQAIVDADESPESSGDEPDEYEGLAGVTLNKFGIYANVDGGTKRICALSFANVEMLKSMETGTISAIEADILVNGARVIRQGLELDTFSSVQQFNKFCARFGHAFQGNDSNIRGLYMRVVESAKKSGKEFYVTAREGLDIVNIPNHENEALREPFMLWADGRGVVLEPRVENENLNIRFQGYPDSRGQFKIDLGDAPNLVEWLKEPGNKDSLGNVIEGMLNCQREDVISKMVGWTVACFYRMLFHKAYGKFPLMHVNAPAGTGKSEMSKATLGFFYYHQDPRVLSPSSTLFALSYSASGSCTPPLMIDEYKPHVMPEVMKERLKLMFRDAYNCREQQRGGGTRDNDDYRSIHTTTLSAPMAFIAEAVEEESAVMERVVLVTISRPHAAQAARDFAQFQKWQRGSNLLAIMGKYIAAQIVRKYSVEQLQADFDRLYDTARKRFMLTEEDINSDKLSLEEMTAKQGTKERTVFNYTVAAFGLDRFRTLVKGIFGERFEPKFEQLAEGLYGRMDDLAMTTQPEWLKVFNVFGDMSTITSNEALVPNKDYAVVQHAGRDCLELNVRMAYNKYRVYCKNSGVKPLYSGETAFLHGLRDCQARVPTKGTKLPVPGGSHLFDLEKLTQLGFRGIKSK